MPKIEAVAFEITDKTCLRFCDGEWRFMVYDKGVDALQYKIISASKYLIDKYQIEDELKVSINIRGREWKSPQGEVKYFNTLEAWRVEKAGAGQPMQQAPQHRQRVLPL